MADGIFYRDLRQPFVILDQTGITVNTAFKALWAPYLTITPANYWTIGKTVKLSAFIKWSSGTSGNITWAQAYGPGDNPSPIVQSVARAYVPSVGPFGVHVVGYATCRITGVGGVGTLSQWGHAQADLGIVLSTSGPTVFPSGGTTVVSTVDTTVGTNTLTFQALASAGVHTMTTVGLLMEACN